MFRFHLIVSFYFAVFQVDLRIFICPHICSIESFTFDHQVCKFGAPNWRLIQVWIQSSAYLSWSFMIFPLMFPLMFPLIFPSFHPFPLIFPTFPPHFLYISPDFPMEKWPGRPEARPRLAVLDRPGLLLGTSAWRHRRIRWMENASDGIILPSSKLTVRPCQIGVERLVKPL